ncbi:hypothetical protein [Acidaminobacter hydrogenoformans]|uniref:hypothetical protein n=1 Tax=Acidaminobacter hydrogenoformans TaxID=65403 RepID=UPI000B8A0B18|nr:hypothetical protein [Acidaminobacter hydrogenoformans]
MALDELKDTDVVDNSNAVNFVMEKDLFETFGDIKVEFVGNGYHVAPANQDESDCSSCSGCN